MLVTMTFKQRSGASRSSPRSAIPRASYGLAPSNYGLAPSNCGVTPSNCGLAPSKMAAVSYRPSPRLQTAASEDEHRTGKQYDRYHRLPGNHSQIRSVHRKHAHHMRGREIARPLR